MEEDTEISSKPESPQKSEEEAAAAMNRKSDSENENEQKTPKVCDIKHDEVSIMKKGTIEFLPLKRSESRSSKSDSEDDDDSKSPIKDDKMKNDVTTLPNDEEKVLESKETEKEDPFVSSTTIYSASLESSLASDTEKNDEDFSSETEQSDDEKSVDTGATTDDGNDTEGSAIEDVKPLAVVANAIQNLPGKRGNAQKILQWIQKEFPDYDIRHSAVQWQLRRHEAFKPIGDEEVNCVYKFDMKYADAEAFKMPKVKPKVKPQPTIQELVKTLKEFKIVLKRVWSQRCEMCSELFWKEDAYGLHKAKCQGPKDFSEDSNDDGIEMLKVIKPKITVDISKSSLSDNDCDLKPSTSSAKVKKISILSSTSRSSMDSDSNNTNIKSESLGGDNIENSSNAGNVDTIPLAQLARQKKSMKRPSVDSSSKRSKRNEELITCDKCKEHFNSQTGFRKHLQDCEDFYNPSDDEPDIDHEILDEKAERYDSETYKPVSIKRRRVSAYSSTDSSSDIISVRPNKRKTPSKVRPRNAVKKEVQNDEVIEIETSMDGMGPSECTGCRIHFSTFLELTQHVNTYHKHCLNPTCKKNLGKREKGLCSRCKPKFTVKIVLKKIAHMPSPIKICIYPKTSEESSYDDAQDSFAQETSDEERAIKKVNKVSKHSKKPQAKKVKQPDAPKGWPRAKRRRIESSEEVSEQSDNNNQAFGTPNLAPNIAAIVQDMVGELVTSSSNESSTEKPNHKNPELIQMALESLPQNEGTKHDVVNSIAKKFPYYANLDQKLWASKIHICLRENKLFTRDEAGLYRIDQSVAQNRRKNRRLSGDERPSTPQEGTTKKTAKKEVVEVTDDDDENNANAIPRLEIPPRSMERPKVSYRTLTAMAIQNLRNETGTHEQIYRWIEETFPYFHNCETYERNKWQFAIQEELRKIVSPFQNVGNGKFKLDPDNISLIREFKDLGLGKKTPKTAKGSTAKPASAPKEKRKYVRKSVESKKVPSAPVVDPDELFDPEPETIVIHDTPHIDAGIQAHKMLIPQINEVENVIIEEVFENGLVVNQDFGTNGIVHEEVVTTTTTTTSGEKPPKSYYELTLEAFEKMPDKKGTLQQICDHIMASHPFYLAKPGLKKLVLTQLSSNPNQFFKFKHGDDSIWSTNPNVMLGEPDLENVTGDVVVGSSANDVKDAKATEEELYDASKPVPKLEVPAVTRDKPNLTFNCMIAMAIQSSADGNLPAKQIINWIMDTFPFFENRMNVNTNVHHSLTKCPAFEKCGMGLWRIVPEKILSVRAFKNLVKSKTEVVLPEVPKLQIPPRSNEKPTISYQGMIAMALQNLPNEQGHVKSICDWLKDVFPFYQSVNFDGFMKQINLQLSKNNAFMKTKDESKTSVWKIDRRNFTSIKEFNELNEQTEKDLAVASIMDEFVNDNDGDNIVASTEEDETNDINSDINSLLEEEVIENALIEVKPGLFYQDFNSTEKPIITSTDEDQTNLPTNDPSEEIINEIGKLTDFVLDPTPISTNQTTSKIHGVTYDPKFKDPNYKFTYKCKECTFDTSESDDIIIHTLKVHHAVDVSRR